MVNKLCAIFGENPDELTFGYDEEHYLCAEMKMRLIYAIEGMMSENCTTFVSTLEQGAAMWGGEACIAIKELGGKIDFVAAPTCDGQANRWHPERRERYFNLLIKADDVVEPDEELYGEDYILCNADSMIVLGDISCQRLANITERAKEVGIRVFVV